MEQNKFTLKEKKELSKELKDYTKEEIKEDFLKLKDIKCSNVNVHSLIGNKIVDYFTFYERLDVIGRRGLNYYDFLMNINKLRKTKYYKSLKEYSKNDNMTQTMLDYKYGQLYWGLNVAIFKPIIAKHIYCMFKPSSILDFTMGWGGRMIGACSLDIPNYIGIDLNKDLKKPITDMAKFVAPYTQTKIKLFFKDALSVDYSKLYYDFVLTSPPYYNIEQYKYNEKLSKEEWNNNFYIPIITKTYKHLQKNGVYCLNIPLDVYEVVKKILGKSDKKIKMWKSKRTKTVTEEWIYIWYKSS
jgi:hypothetical protein